MSLKERAKKGKKVTPTDETITKIVGSRKTKDKYPVNVVFDGELEQDIRDRAKELGLGVATYIKSLVVQDLNK